MFSMRPLVVIALAGLGFVSSQAVNELPGCGQTCYTSMVSQQGAALGCPNGEIPCLCSKPDFLNGIRDCAKAACASDLLPPVTIFANALCATAVPQPPVTPTTPPPAPATSTPATTSSTPSATVSPATATPVLPSSTTSSSSTSVQLTTAPSSSSTTGVLTSSSSATSTTNSAAPSTTKATSSVTAPASSSPSTAAAEDSSAAPGLSTGAKIGVGVGAAAGGVALIALAMCLFVSRRHKKQPGSNGSFKISDPLPGSGRTYANDHHHQQYGTGSSELEKKSRRYEDMLPRQSPRTMV